MSAPFGAFAPSPFEERVRAAAHRLPANDFGRKAASALLGAAGGRSGRAFDVTLFGSQKARLHPHDNICEKRVFLTPQLWDPAERALLGAAIRDFGGQTFRFVDVGANVGLYTLFARAEALRAGAALQAVCVEADGDMAARLRFNLEASGASGDVALFECAASDAEGEVRFSVNRESRGLSRVDAAGALIVPARPLLPIVLEAGLDRIDAMKIDIEGHEHPMLDAFLAAAPKSLWPRLLILETSHAEEDRSALKLAERAGFLLVMRTKRNACLRRQE